MVCSLLGKGSVGQNKEGNRVIARTYVVLNLSLDHKKDVLVHRLDNPADKGIAGSCLTAFEVIFMQK